MLIQFISLPSWLQILIWSVGGIMLGGVVTLTVRSLTSETFRAEHNEETGVIVAMVGVFYGLIVTAVLVQAVGHFNDAKSVAERESNLADAVARQARATSPELGDIARQYILKYLNQTIFMEWPMQQKGHNQGISTKTLDTLTTVVLRYEPINDKQRISYGSLLSALDLLYEARKERSFRIRAEISPELWAVSLTGEVALVLFAMLMHIRSRWMHFLMASAMSVSISMVFALILIFDTPFAGDISISPEPYEWVWHHLGGTE